MLSSVKSFLIAFAVALLKFALIGYFAMPQIKSLADGFFTPGDEEAEDTAEEAEIFESLVRHSPLPFFWKDRNRRFIGASQAFLDYYGLSSEEEIQGKTDEDMGWHLNNETYQDDEDQVLSTGLLHRNVPGRCVSKGVPRTIYER